MAKDKSEKQEKKRKEVSEAAEDVDMGDDTVEKVHSTEFLAT